MQWPRIYYYYLGRGRHTEKFDMQVTMSEAVAAACAGRGPKSIVRHPT